VKDAQRRVAEFVHAHDLSAGVETRLLDLVAEMGELAKEGLKGTDYGSVTMLPDSEWSSEMGDMIYSLLALANETGVDLETALASALTKYRARIAERSDPGSPSS
jgi:NTP pyrophosphatase (non-canonical NTP hydrolase)